MGANVGAHPRHIENLRIGGGYGSEPDGGADLDAAGNIDADGGLTLGGDLIVGGQVNSDLAVAGDLRLAGAGCNKTWFLDLCPGAHLVPTTSNGAAGPVQTVINVHETLYTLDFAHTANKYALVNFVLPPDYDGSTLKIIAYWTSTTATAGGAVRWKLYGNLTGIGAGEPISQGSTGLLGAVTDALAVQGGLQAPSFNLNYSASPGDLFTGFILNDTVVGTLDNVAQLIRLRLTYA